MFSVVMKISRVDVERAINLSVPLAMQTQICHVARKVNVYVEDGRAVTESGRSEALRCLRKHIRRWGTVQGNLRVLGTDKGLLVANIKLPKGKFVSPAELEHIGELIPYEKVFEHILAVRESKTMVEYVRR